MQFISKDSQKCSERGQWASGSLTLSLTLLNPCTTGSREGRSDPSEIQTVRSTRASYAIRRHLTPSGHETCM